MGKVTIRIEDRLTPNHTMETVAQEIFDLLKESDDVCGKLTEKRKVFINGELQEPF